MKTTKAIDLVCIITRNGLDEYDFLVGPTAWGRLTSYLRSQGCTDNQIDRAFHVLVGNESTYQPE